MAPEMLWEGLDLIKEVDHAINIPVSIDEWDGDKIMDVASDGIYQYWATRKGFKLAQKQLESTAYKRN